MKSVGLFVDYESTHSSLRKAVATALSHEKIGRHVLNVASSFGELVVRVAWADWDRFPGAQRALARLGFDTRFVVANPGDLTAASSVLEKALLKLASQSDAPDLFVVAGTSPTLASCAGEVRRFGKNMVVLAREDAVPAAIRGAVGLFEQLSLPPGQLGSSRPRGVGVDFRKDPETETAMLGQVRSALIAMLSERRLPWVSFRLFSDYLVANGVATPDSVKHWIERAVAKGYVCRDRERGATRPFYKFTPGRLPGRNTPDPHQGSAGASGSLFRSRSRSAGRQGTESRDVSYRPWTAGDTAGRWNQDWRNFTFVRMLWALWDTLEDEAHRPLSSRAVTEAFHRWGIGLSDEEISFWVNQAVDRGLLIRESETRGEPTSSQASWYRINLEHRLVTSAETVPAAIVQTIDMVLRRCTDWQGIAFNFLIRLLRVHPALSNPADEYHVFRLREWTNFLIGEGVLSKFEEPDLKDPARKTTMVTNNLSHPHTKRLLEQAPDAPFYRPEHQAVLRTILMIDHFLYWLHTKSPDEDWLPLMTLKSWLRNSLGDQLTKWAVAACELARIFTIDRHRNNGGSEATVAGVRLSYSHPLVRETLVRRDQFLKLLLRLLQNRASIPYRVIEKQLVEDSTFGDTPTERLGWFALMVDAKVVTVDDVGTEFEDRGAGLVCRLNAREKFVGELVTRVIRGEDFEPSGTASDRLEEPDESPRNPDWGEP